MKMSETVFLLHLVGERLQQWKWEWTGSSGRSNGGSRDAGRNWWSSTKMKSLRLCTRRAGRGSPVSHTVRASVLLPDFSGLWRGSLDCTPVVLVGAGKGSGSGSSVATPSGVWRGLWAS